jgi:hypothetical protein
MTVLLTLTTAGFDSGPFDLYSNVDSYVTPFETGVTKTALTLGYTTSLCPDFALVVRIRSTGNCKTFIDVPLTYPPATTTTTTTCVGFSYFVSTFNCGSCTPIGTEGLINEFPLTLNKYYYDNLTHRVKYITGYAGCFGSFSTSILDSEGKNTCLEVPCPSTTTTSTTIAGTTTTTTTLPFFEYEADYAVCSSCGSLFAIGNAKNSVALTVNKWYYDSLYHYRVRPTLFVGMSAGPATVNINPLSEKDTCAEIICPTTTTTTTIAPFNFDVENADWSAIGVTDISSFQSFMMTTFTNMSSIIVSDFNIVNNGALKCNLVCTPSGSTHNINWASKGITKFNNLSGLSLATYLVASTNNLTEMAAFEPLVNLIAIELQSNPITVFKGLNTCTNLIYIDVHSCDIATIVSMPALTLVDTLVINDNLITTSQWDNLNPWALAVTTSGNINTAVNTNPITTSVTNTTLLGKGWTIL